MHPHHNMIKLTDNLPDEVTLPEAADLLGVSVRTVRRYIDEGLLIARNIAPLSSIRARWRLPLSAVIELRSGYGVQTRQQRPTTRRTSKARPYVPKMLRVN